MTVAFQFWAILSALLAWIFDVAFRSAGTSSTMVACERDSAKPTIETVIEFLLLAMSLGCMQGLTIWLFAQMPVGYALALFQLSSLLQVILGRALFGERELGRRLFAASVMTAGAVLVLLSG